MIKDVLTSYAPKGFAILQQAIANVSVTGKTLKSLGFAVDTINLKLTYFGRGFMEALEKGRGPRKEPGYGGFDKGLEEWLNAKGFAQRKTKSGTVYYQIGSQWFSAKSLAWRINKQGDRQFRSGTPKEVYTKAMQDFKAELIEAVKKDQRDELFRKIKDEYK